MIQYRRLRHYKYVLHSDHVYPTGIQGYAIKTPYLALTNSGELTIKQGYAWDGPSGLTLHTKNFLRGSLIHDALYQLLREQQLPRSLRLEADKILRQVCRQDGMSWLRANWVYLWVRIMGGFAAKPDLRTAP